MARIRITRRSLSRREAQLVLGLEWDKQRVFTTRDIARRLRCSDNYARWLAHSLQKKGWLETMVPGTYLLIGADRGPQGIPEGNPYVIARILPEPYFFAYRWACVHHGLGTQVPTLVHIALTRPKRPAELHHVRFEFVELSEHRMFGYEEVVQLGERINVSDLERTTLDALDRPELVGGIEAGVEAVFHAGRKRADRHRLLAYLQRFNDSALARRFGYLCETLKVSLGGELNAYLASQTRRIPACLGPSRRWGKEGPLDKRWSLILNVPKDELMGELHIG